MSTKLKVTVIASSLAILLFTIVGGFVNVRASSNDGAYRQLLGLQRGAVAHPPGIRRRAQYRRRHRRRAARSAGVARRQFQLPVGRRIQALQGDEERRQGRISAPPSPSASDTRPWSRSFPEARRTRPGSRTPTSSSRSRARARTTCRWLRFTACCRARSDRRSPSRWCGRGAEPQKIVITRDMVPFRRSAKKCWPTTSATSRSTRSRRQVAGDRRQDSRPAEAGSEEARARSAQLRRWRGV
jgi:hypothetical protein